MNIRSYRRTLAIALVSCLAIACGDDDDYNPWADAGSHPGPNPTDGGGRDGGDGIDGGGRDGGDAADGSDGGDSTDGGDGSVDEDGGSSEFCPPNDEGCPCVPGETNITQGSCNEGLICVDWGQIRGFDAKDLLKAGPFATCVKPCTEDAQCESEEREGRSCASANLGGALKPEAAAIFEPIKKICADKVVKSGENCGLSRNIDSWTQDQSGKPNTSITRRDIVACQGTASCVPMRSDLNPDESICFDYCSENAHCPSDTPACGVSWFTGDEFARPKICAVTENKPGDFCSYLWNGRQFINGCSVPNTECTPMPPERFTGVFFTEGGKGGICAYYAKEATATQPAVACPPGTVEDSTVMKNLCSEGCTSAPDNCEPTADGDPRVCVDYTAFNTDVLDLKASLCAAKAELSPPLEATVLRLNEDQTQFIIPPLDGLRCYKDDFGFTACPDGTNCVFMGPGPDGKPLGICTVTCESGFRLDPSDPTRTATITSGKPKGPCPKGQMCHPNWLNFRPEMGFCITSTLPED